MRGIGSYGNSRSWYSPFLYTPKRTPLRLSSRLMSPRLLTSSSANCRADRSVMATPCLTDTHAERLCSMILNSSQRMRPWFPHSLEKSTIMLRIGRAANGSPACRTSAFAPTPASTACAWRVYARPVRRARRRRDRRRAPASALAARSALWSPRAAARPSSLGTSRSSACPCRPVCSRRPASAPCCERRRRRRW